MVLGKAAFIVALILIIIIRYPYRSAAKQIIPQDRQEQLLLLLVGIGMMLLPLVYIFTDRLAFANYTVPIWVMGMGIVVDAAGLWLFWRSHTDLGRNWSSTLEIHEEHTLVTQGVYQRIRHPMYAASWLIMLGQALLLSNWIAGLGGLVSFGLMYFLRVPREERMMLEAFGEQYRQYMSRTGRIIPKGGFSQ